MKTSELIKKARAVAAPFRITHGKGFHLKDVNPAHAKRYGRRKKLHSKEMLGEQLVLLTALQDKMYAADKFGVLLIFQGMDGAGKDGAVKHVMSGVNPQGCQVASFKAPSSEELDHDFLWRCTRRLPNRGHIGIFNRSYYEEVLVVRVHPEFLAKQRLPESLIGKDIWKNRFKEIRDYEEHLSRNGIVVLKFFLHMSKDEQKTRFLERLNRPEKNWKFSEADLKERGFWKKYQKAYEQMIRHTSTEHAPWYVVPADKKWFARLVISSAIIDLLTSLKLAYPKVDKDQKTRLAEAKKQLLAGK